MTSEIKYRTPVSERRTTVNGSWFHAEMCEAETRLQKTGYESADLRDIMLVGFKYLGERDATVRLQLTGKVLFPVGMLLGGLIIGAGQALIKVVV